MYRKVCYNNFINNKKEVSAELTVRTTYFHNVTLRAKPLEMWGI